VLARCFFRCCFALFAIALFSPNVWAQFLQKNTLSLAAAKKMAAALKPKQPRINGPW
jgi:hypothetical protein